MKKKKISKQFLEASNNLFDENKNLQPSNFDNFKEIINQESNLFIESSENNVKYFFLYQKMHNELNEKNNVNEIEEFDSDQTVPEIELYKCINNFELKNKSIISDIFYFSQVNIKKCIKCGVCLYNFTMHNNLIFLLEKTKLYKESKQNPFESINLYDCFEYYTTKENKIFDNKMNCESCKEKYEISNKISTLPEIFTIFLVREINNNIDYKFQINDEIEDLDKYMINFNEITGHEKQKYKLIGIIIENSKEKSKYISFCKSPIDDKQWYLNDNSQIINNIDPFEEIKAIPYFLIYQKM